MKHLDFTNENENGFIEGLYVKKYGDGEALVKIFFENWDVPSQTGFQDEVDTWLTREQIEQLIETLRED